MVVPLSGGYDSRAILAALLELTEPQNILTFTFGTPGTLDYEIGAAVAREVGVKHHAFDLTKSEVTEEKLMRIARLTDGNADLFQPVYLLDIFDRIGTDKTVWSGYTGDGVGGSHFKEHASDDRDSAIDGFVRSESIGLLRPDTISEEAKACIVTDSIYKGVLDIHEEIFFVNHVERLTTSGIFPNHVRHATPFMDDAFTQFMWGVATEYRRNCQLFKRIWKVRYPDVFSLPLKDNWGFRVGLPRRARRLLALFDRIADKVASSYVRKPTNFVSYAKKLRFDQSFRGLVESLIDSIVDIDLEGYGIDVSRLLREHRTCVRDHSRALTNLASLGAIRQAFD